MMEREGKRVSIGRPPQTYEQRTENFHRGYIPVTDCGCWLWERRLDKYGYGEFVIPKKTTKAHRASWIFHFGDIPEGLNVLHKCDNPACVNPQHLFLGTTKDNNSDKVKKGRQLFGESHGRAILTESEVLTIRTLCATTSLKKLADQYNVHPSTIKDIKTGKNWKYLTGGD